MNVQYADIIIFAIVAVYLGIKLYATLGKRDKDGNNFLGKFSARATADAEKLTAKPVILVEKLEQKIQQPQPQPAPAPEIIFINPEVEASIKEISAKDAAFSVVNFLNNAKAAFEGVIEGYSKKDKDAIQKLLSNDLFVKFSKAIEDMKAKGLEQATSVVSISKAEIVEANLNGNIAKIKIEFISEQISFLKDAEGNIAQGNTSQIDEVEDTWVFERDLTAKTQNWEVVAI